MNASLSDGLLRLRRQDLGAITLVHLVSGVDDDIGEDGARRCGTATTLSGYTEWVSAQEPQLSLGWDWQVDTTPASPQVVRLGLPRTNVLVLSEEHGELPWDESLRVLATFIDGFDWNTPAFQAVCQRYAS